MPGFVWVGDHWERVRAPKTETQTPLGKPGFVWVGDHWERERAKSNVTTIVDPYPGVLGTSNTSSPTITVRDHTNGTTQLVTPNGTITIRDHGGSASGGVKVTSDPIIRDHRNGAIIRDHRNGADQGGKGDSKGAMDSVYGAVGTVGDAVGSVFHGLGVISEDALTPVSNGASDVINLFGSDDDGSGSDSSNGTIVRDHRTAGPANVTVVRDHRN